MLRLAAGKVKFRAGQGDSAGSVAQDHGRTRSYPACLLRLPRQVRKDEAAEPGSVARPEPAFRRVAPGSVPDADDAVLLLVDQRTGHRDRGVAEQEEGE